MTTKNWNDGTIINGDYLATSSFVDMASHITANDAKTGVTDQISNVVEDTTPQLGGNLDLNSKGIILASQTVSSGVSTSNIAYFNGTSWNQADADQSTTCDGMLGMYLGSSTILIDGIFTTTGLTAGDTYYVSTTDGAITNTAPVGSGDIVRIIGMALSTTQLLFKPEGNYMELT